MVKLDKERCDIMQEAMRQIGWSPGAEIPMASEENLLLMTKLRDIMVQKAEIADELEDTNDVLDKLHKHCRNAEDTINSNLELLDAHQSEWRSESHLSKLAERCTSKLNQEIKDNHKEVANYKHHIETTEKELCKRKKSIEQRTNRIQWAKTALLEWREAVAQGQRGFELIQKYSKEDEVRARQQDLKRQGLVEEIIKYRKELVDLYNEQKTLEQNLERTANLYRTAHIERRQMVDMWKSAVQQMTQREQDIVSAEKYLRELRQKFKEKENTRKQYAERLDTIIQNNRAAEEAIEELNEQSSSIKQELQQIQDTYILKENELEGFQKELQNLANHVHQQRAENRQKSKDLGEKLEQLNAFQSVLDSLVERLESMESKNMNAQQRLQIMEDLIETEEKSHKQIEKEIQRTNELLFRAQQKLSETKNDNKIMVVSNAGIRASLQALEKSSHELEKELQRTTEVHYGLAFKCLETERKIIKQQGGTLDPEVEQRNEQYLVQLEEYNEKMVKRLATTEAQNKKLNDNMRALTTSYNNDSKQLEVMQFNIKEAQVYCEGSVKRLKIETQKNQMLIVELSILKLRVREFENEIVKCNDSVYSLEKHRAHLNRSVKDRLVEIKSQLDILYQKRKHLQEERSVLRADIGERNSKIEAVRSRFELTKKLLGTNEDGTVVTATQLRVEVAQEKQLLLDEGNELNERVLKAEKEVKALENTLKMFMCSNNNYRRSVQSKDEVDAEEELKTMNDNFCKMVCMIKTLRTKYVKLESEVHKLVEEKEALQDEIKVLMKKCANATEERDSFKRELDNQKSKLDRAEKELKRLIKSVRQAGRMSEEQILLQERELDCRELEKRSMTTLNQLSDWAESDIVIGPEIITRVLKRGLQLPRTMAVRSKTSLRSDSSALTAEYSARSEVSFDSVTCCRVTTSRVSVLSLELPSKQ